MLLHGCVLDERSSGSILKFRNSLPNFMKVIHIPCIFQEIYTYKIESIFLNHTVYQFVNAAHIFHLPQKKICVKRKNKPLVTVTWMSIFMIFFNEFYAIYAISNGKVLMLLWSNYMCEVVTSQAWCEQLRRRRAPCVALQCVCLRCTGRCDFAIVYGTEVTKYM